MKQPNHKQNIKNQKEWRVGGARVACVLVAALDTIKMVTRALPLFYMAMINNIADWIANSRNGNLFGLILA